VPLGQPGSENVRTETGDERDAAVKIERAPAQPPRSRDESASDHPRAQEPDHSAIDRQPAADAHEHGRESETVRPTEVRLPRLESAPSERIFVAPQTPSCPKTAKPAMT
jgi:hypothetical protein